MLVLIKLISKAGLELKNLPVHNSSCLLLLAKEPP